MGLLRKIFPCARLDDSVGCIIDSNTECSYCQNYESRIKRRILSMFSAQVSYGFPRD